MVVLLTFSGSDVCACAPKLSTVRITDRDYEMYSHRGRGTWKMLVEKPILLKGHRDKEGQTHLATKKSDCF